MKPESRYLSARTAIESAVAAAISTALALIVFGPIWSRMSGPLAGGDMLSTYAGADNWGGLGFITTSHFGFPAGMNLNHSPNIDLTENSIAKLLNILGGSPFLGVNLLLFLSFPAVGALAYLLLRMVSRGGPVEIALAVAFSMIPYHFGRGLGHTYLATMYGAVTAVMLATLVGLGYLPRILRTGSGRRRVATWLLLVGLIVATAWSGLYYAAFAVILGIAALVWRIARGDSWRRLAAECLPVLAVVVLAVAGFVPGLIASVSDPPTASFAERSAAESVSLAGSLAMALTPAPISTLPGMGHYNDYVNRATAAVTSLGPPTESTSLTNFGTWITTACALLFVLGWVYRSRRRTARGSPIPFVGLLTAVVIAFFVPSGLNLMFATAVTAQVRGWNRLLPVLLLLFVMGAMAVLARTRWDRLSAPAVLGGALIVVVAAVGQVVPFRTAYQQGAEDGAAALSAARTYEAAVNTAIPERCGVLQLPYVQYPEQGLLPPDLGDYEHFLQPLANPDKDFSYGAVKGTAAGDVVRGLDPIPSGAQLDYLRSLGFCAIHVDRRGIPDSSWGFMDPDLTSTLGAPIATGDAGLWRMYDLRAK